MPPQYRSVDGLWLKLNGDKTKFICISSKGKLRRVHIWGNYAFRWATTSTYPVVGLQTEEICSSRELTRRHMASVLLALLAFPLETLFRSRFVNQKPWLFLNLDCRLICFIIRILKTDCDLILFVYTSYWYPSSLKTAPWKPPPSVRTADERADLIKVFKILRGFENLDSDRFFQVIGDGARRGHSFKLFKKRYRLDVGKFKFASRVCEEWNRLGDGIVSAGTVNVFKMRLALDHHLRNVRGIYKRLLFSPADGHPWRYLHGWILVNPGKAAYTQSQSLFTYGYSTFILASEVTWLVFENRLRWVKCGNFSQISRILSIAVSALPHFT